jgi:hypothetical protein
LWIVAFDRSLWLTEHSLIVFHTGFYRRARRIPPGGDLRHAKSQELTVRKELREHFSDPAVQLAGALK